MFQEHGLLKNIKEKTHIKNLKKKELQVYKLHLYIVAIPHSVYCNPRHLFQFRRYFSKENIRACKKNVTLGRQISQKILENTSMEFILDLKSRRT